MQLEGKTSLDLNICILKVKLHKDRNANILSEIIMEAVRPYSTKPGTQEMSLMALTLYFLTQTLYTKYKIEERPPLE